MKLVVSDTSPVRALAHLGLLDLLPRMYEDVYVPPTVAAELRCPPVGQVAVEVDDYPFLLIAEPRQATLSGLGVSLHRGEEEAIALALDLSAGLLIDEARGRRAAITRGLRITGTLGVLTDAKSRGMVKALRPLLDRLRAETRFFLSAPLCEAMLRSVGE